MITSRKKKKEYSKNEDNKSKNAKRGNLDDDQKDHFRKYTKGIKKVMRVNFDDKKLKI